MLRLVHVNVAVGAEGLWGDCTPADPAPSGLTTRPPGDLINTKSFRINTSPEIPPDTPLACGLPLAGLRLLASLLVGGYPSYLQRDALDSLVLRINIICNSE
jgi:hypothetical protein